MSSYSGFESSVGRPLPGVEVLDIGGGLDPNQFTEFVKSLTIPAHADWAGNSVEARPARLFDRALAAASRTPEKPRDPWAPDHYWHFDGGYSGEANQFASVLYAQHLRGRVAGTEFIDTAELLLAVESDQPGLTEELSACTGEYSVTRYYTDILSALGEVAGNSIERTLQSKNASSLAEVAHREDVRYPIKHFPALLTHPFRRELCSMVDDLNLVRLLGVNATRGAELMRRMRDEYLNLLREELSDIPYYYRHQWQECQVVVFPQVGTMHRAEPSPAGELRRDTLRLFVA